MFLKLLPCIPCLWKARTESVRQTEKGGKSKKGTLVRIATYAIDAKVKM